jgi:hypothetical protein
MAKKRFWLGILVMALVFGMTVVGCGNDSSSEDSKKTLVLTDIPANVYSYASSGGSIGVFKEGTTPQQAERWENIVAGADLYNDDVIVTGNGPYTVTVPLYNIDNYNRWTGSGTFDVYLELGYYSTRYYKASSVKISSGKTTISFNDGTEVYP